MDRIEKILEVSIDLFNKNGIEKTTIQDINEKCEVARGTFYYYFKNKDELLDFIHKQYITCFMDKVSKELVSFQEKGSDYLKFLVEYTFSFYEENPILIQLAHRGSNKEHSQKVFNLIKDEINRIFHTKFPFLESNYLTLILILIRSTVIQTLTLSPDLKEYNKNILIRMLRNDIKTEMET